MIFDEFDVGRGRLVDLLEFNILFFVSDLIPEVLDERFRYGFDCVAMGLSPIMA